MEITFNTVAAKELIKEVPNYSANLVSVSDCRLTDAKEKCFCGKTATYVFDVELDPRLAAALNLPEEIVLAIDCLGHLLEASSAYCDPKAHLRAENSRLVLAHTCKHGAIS